MFWRRGRIRWPEGLGPSPGTARPDMPPNDSGWAVRSFVESGQPKKDSWAAGTPDPLGRAGFPGSRACFSWLCDARTP
jgi:hypothetical protein